MEEIILQRKLEALGQNGTLIRKDGKTFLQLDCENAKELSMKWGEKLYPFTKTGKKWILELPFSTPVNYVQICVDGQEVLSPELPSHMATVVRITILSCRMKTDYLSFGMFPTEH